MLTHMRQKHQDVAEIESPLGSFPSSTSATTLQFDESDRPATQGNSRGQINSPKVRTEATFVCDHCEMHFPTNDDARKHIAEAHDNSVGNTTNNDDGDEEHLGDALDDVEATELGIVAREVERMAFMYKHAEQNCHNCAMSKEVESDKERMLKEKDSKIDSMKRRQVKTDQEKNELYREKKKVITENAALKNELKKCQDLLAETQRKVTTLTVERRTEASLSVAAEDEGGNVEMKCTRCDFNSRNPVLFDSHM